MDQYETRLRADIASCAEQIVQLRADINAQMVRKSTLEHALAVYEETKPRRAASGGSTGRMGSYSSRVLEVIRQSGTRGLTTNEIYQKVEEAGIGVRSGNIRSLLYERRKSGILERLEDGRHRFVSSSVNGASDQESRSAGCWGSRRFKREPGRGPSRLNPILTERRERWIGTRPLCWVSKARPR